MRRFEAENIELCLSTDVLNIMQGFKQLKRRSKESGGILLGQVVGNKFFITRITMPNKFDQQSRFSFHRDKDVAQILADYEYINSQGKTIYLGEWHTHPELFPTPSSRDIKMIKEQFDLGKNLRRVIFMVIQGQKGLFAGIFDGQTFYSMKELF